MATQENLQAAFAGESQANRRYLAFAAKADAEKLPQIAKLFRAVAAAETIHAHSHLRAMNAIGDTKSNLEAALAGEAFEFKEMYPAFFREAQADGNKNAAESFRNAMEVEQGHHGLYGQALAAAATGKDLPAGPIVICDQCGHTVVGRAPDTCPVCGASRTKFKEVS